MRTNASPPTSLQDRLTRRRVTQGTMSLPVRQVGLDESAGWLAAGWRDFLRSPITSLTYGSVFVVIGYSIFAWFSRVGMGSLVLPFLAAFMLIGPVAAVGMYEVARRHERGEEATLLDSFKGFRRNTASVVQMGFVLMMAMYAWIQLALILFMLFFGAEPPPLDDFVGTLLFSFDSLPFLIAGTLVGGAIAAGVFAISVVSMPLLLDRPEVSTASAIATSWRACRENWKLMIGWAAAIACIGIAGLSFFIVGLAVVLPWLGYASWHAYRSLVEPL